MKVRRGKFVNFSGGRRILEGVDALSVSDAALAALARGGDVEAAAGVLARYQPSLYAAAIRLLRNREDAVDAVQETCVTALGRFGALRDPAAVGGWLHAVLRNCCLMRLRHAGRETPSDQIELPQAALSPDDV